MKKNTLDHSPQCWSEVFFHLPKCL